MHLASIRFTNFRGYAALGLPLPGGLCALVGDNAQGKTNLLRGIELLGLGRASSEVTGDGDLVRFGETLGSVEGITGSGAGAIRMLAGISERGVSLKLNGKAVSRPRWMGRLPVLFVGPSDRATVEGPPASRRDVLDELLEQSEPAYLAAVREYRGALRQRNRALAEPASSDAQLEIWEEPMSRAGGRILARRSALVAEISPRATAWHRELAGPDAGGLALAYRSTVAAPGGAATCADAAAWGAALADALAGGRERDRALGTTQAGPHRDDVAIALGDRIVKGTGSSGEVWTAVLAFALAGAETLAGRLGSFPVLLLDDVLAALDDARRLRLLDVVGGFPQALLTTTAVPAGYDGRVLHVRNHSVTDGRRAADGAPAREGAWSGGGPVSAALA